MGENRLNSNVIFMINANGASKKKKDVIFYEIMHMEKKVAKISSNGKAEVYLEDFMPYDLYLEKEARLDAITFYGMNILDYLTGNTDRHPENWFFWVDNETNRYTSLYPLMDFNQCFLAYDNLEGANCQTVYPRKLTQREAAIEAVKKIGLPQIHEMDMSAFEDMTAEAEMFQRRLEELRKYGTL